MSSCFIVFNAATCVNTIYNYINLIKSAGSLLVIEYIDIIVLQFLLK